EWGLAERLAGAVEDRKPYTQHAVVAANAALAESRGDLGEAVGMDAEAAGGWGRLGVGHEQAYAVLGQGGWLAAPGRGAGAGPVARQARELLDALGAAPAIAETDTLLQQAKASSR